MEITWNLVAYAVIILLSGNSKTLRNAGYTSHTEKTENAHKFPVFHTRNGKKKFGDKYIIGYVLTKKKIVIHPLASILLGDINVE